MQAKGLGCSTLSAALPRRSDGAKLETVFVWFYRCGVNRFGGRRFVTEFELAQRVLLRSGTMKLERRPLSGREKDAESAELLEKLRAKLHCDNISVARRAAYNLSWMQEDGLDILREALYSETGRITKTAAAYGLRNMRGRMKKMAIECLQQGCQHTNRRVQEASKRALMLLERGKTGQSAASSRYAKRGKFKVREVSAKNARRPRVRNTYR